MQRVLNILRHFIRLPGRKLLRYLLFLALSVFLFVYLFIESNDERVGGVSSNLLIFLFVNLNILFLCISAFLVGRELFRLFLDRRRNVLGAKIRVRLVIPFVGITTIPLVVLFILASGLLNRAMDGWFNAKFETTKDAALTLAKAHYQGVDKILQEETIRLSRRLARVSIENNNSRKELLDEYRKKHGLFSIALFSKGKHEPLLFSSTPLSAISEFHEPEYNKESIQKAYLKKEVIRQYQLEGAASFLRAYLSFRSSGKYYVLVTSYRFNPEIAESMSMIRNYNADFSQMEMFKNPLHSGYLLMFFLISGMLLFAALWIAVQLARGIVEPIENMVRATHRISKGDFSIRVEPGADDEIGYLINSFNLMAEELQSSRSQTERQKVFMETILSNLAVGVVSLDAEGKVVLSNTVAQLLLQIENPQNERLLEILHPSLAGPIQTVIKEIQDTAPSTSVDIQFTTIRFGREFKIVCTGGKVLGPDGGHMATVLLLDDITELAKAQQMNAWREVARRIAHEIKNPLTPLKLSAQRIQRFAKKQGGHEVLIESTQTIVEHVNSIKRLADEFSNFARMPTSVLREISLVVLVKDVVSSYAETSEGVQFQVITGKTIPPLQLDAEQIRRVLVNLIDNSLGSISAAREQGILKQQSTGRIKFKIHHIKRRRTVQLEVIDNGVGIPESGRHRVFEPYYTTKKGGTGLGLAIVSSIITEHHGVIRVMPLTTNGARIVIEFPLKRNVTTPRVYDRISD